MTLTLTGRACKKDFQRFIDHYMYYGDCIRMSQQCTKQVCMLLLSISILFKPICLYLFQKDSHHLLKELAGICILADLTLILAFRYRM